MKFKSRFMGPDTTIQVYTAFLPLSCRPIPYVKEKLSQNILKPSPHPSKKLKQNVFFFTCKSNSSLALACLLSLLSSEKALFPPPGTKETNGELKFGPVSSFYGIAAGKIRSLPFGSMQVRR